MANVQQPNMEPQIQSAMPLPVKEYVNRYTDEAVKNGYAPKPPPPITESYQMFGQICHQDDEIIRPLESQGITRLHPEVYDKREELKKITVSILCNFLDLLDNLVKSGVSLGRDEKIEDLNILFIHMHHLINEFRPHQARETLKVMMAMQKKNMVEAGERLCKHMEKSSDILRQCSEELAVLRSQTPQASSDVSSHSDSMEVDQLMASSISEASVMVDPSVVNTNGNAVSQDEKDMIMCEMLEGVNE